MNIFAHFIKEKKNAISREGERDKKIKKYCSFETLEVESARNAVHTLGDNRD